MAKVKKQYVDDGNGNKELFYPATISDAVKFPDNSETLTERLSHLSKEDNEEYLAVETDSEGKVLAATYPDGSHYAHNLKSETIPTEFGHIEDPEGRMEITTDSEGRVLGYRDEEGTRHEVKMNADTLKVSNLNLQGNSVNNIQDALKANGFDVKTPIDWSENSYIQIPEPRFAIANITGITAMPTTKTQNLQAWMEFWDMQGNYFKKRVILNAQGNSSMGFIKKNAAIDICNDEWIGDDTAKIRFGDWVPQDSFHLKAYYTDFFRGVCPITYKLYEQIVRTRGDKYDRPWKKGLLDISKIGSYTRSLYNLYVGDYSLLTDTGARCVPDGFPVAIYLNGEFYGVFSWQLKKHRDNYHMDKSTAEHVHLDGTLNINTIFGGKANINWAQFEIRNPKNLYAIGGNKYDADTNQEEIAGEDEVNTWIANGELPDGTAITSKIQKNLQLTAKVKTYIQNFAESMSVIKSAETTYKASSKTDADLKAFTDVIERYYDVENLIDYNIISDIVKNSDGFSKNWQWITYDGIKWFVCPYDCDGSFGGHFLGNQITDVLYNHIGTSLDYPTGYVISYYNTILENRYKELADQGIISAENIVSILKDWTMRIGTDFYEEEYNKWPDSPCISNSEIRDDYWEIMLDDQGIPETTTYESFDATVAYKVGEVVSYGLSNQMGYFLYKCIQETKALSNNTPHTVSQYSPIKVFKHCDNIYRVQHWIEENLSNIDGAYNYNRTK